LKRFAPSPPSERSGVSARIHGNCSAAATSWSEQSRKKRRDESARGNKTGARAAAYHSRTQRFGLDHGRSQGECARHRVDSIKYRSPSSQRSTKFDMGLGLPVPAMYGGGF